MDDELDDIFDMDCVCGYPKGDCRCEDEQPAPDRPAPEES